MQDRQSGHEPKNPVVNFCLSQTTHFVSLMNFQDKTKLEDEGVASVRPLRIVLMSPFHNLASVVVQLVAQFLTLNERLRLARVSRISLRCIDQPFAWLYTPRLLVTQPIADNCYGGVAARYAPVDIRWAFGKKSHGKELQHVKFLHTYAIRVDRDWTDKAEALTSDTRNVIRRRSDQFSHVRELIALNCGHHMHFTLMLLTSLPHLRRAIFKQTMFLHSGKALCTFLTELSRCVGFWHFNELHLYLPQLEEIDPYSRHKLVLILKKVPSVRVTVHYPVGTSTTPPTFKSLSALHERLKVTIATESETKSQSWLQSAYRCMCSLLSDVAFFGGICTWVMAQLIGALLAVAFRWLSRPRV